MNKILLCLFFAVSLFFISCDKEQLSPEAPGMDSVSNDAIEKYAGDFMDGPHGHVSGSAKVILLEGKYQLVLDDFMTSNGPDLKVYLSKQVQPLNFIKLGDLKSISGQQVYDIPAGTDFLEYKYALIHCEQFNHLFGSAELK